MESDGGRWLGVTVHPREVTLQKDGEEQTHGKVSVFICWGTWAGTRQGGGDTGEIKCWPGYVGSECHIKVFGL